MLKHLDEFRYELRKNGVPDELLGKLDSSVERLSKANREYFMGSKVQDLIDKASGKVVKRGAISKTDTTLGALGAAAGIATGNPAMLLPIAAKKAFDYTAPRAALYAPEALKKVEKVGGMLQKGLDTLPVRPAVTQQLTQEVISPPTSEEKPWEAEDTPQTPWEAARGTKYEQIFKSQDQKENAVNHKILMSRDPEYRKKIHEES